MVSESDGTVLFNHFINVRSGKTFYDGLSGCICISGMLAVSDYETDFMIWIKNASSEVYDQRKEWI